MKRRPARLVSLWVLAAILFAQLATAAYACEFLARDVDRALPNVEMAAPCDEPDAIAPDGRSALCFEHCKFGGQLVDNHPSVDPAAQHPVIAPLVVPLLVTDAPARWRCSQQLATHASSPPVFASSARLRI